MADKQGRQYVVFRCRGMTSSVVIWTSIVIFQNMTPFKIVSVFQSSEEEIIYSTVLVYSPEPSDGGLLRLDGATIPVECHYDK